MFNNIVNSRLSHVKLSTYSWVQISRTYIQIATILDNAMEEDASRLFMSLLVDLPTPQYISQCHSSIECVDDPLSNSISCSCPITCIGNFLVFFFVNHVMIWCRKPCFNAQVMKPGTCRNNFATLVGTEGKFPSWTVQTSRTNKMFIVKIQDI